MATVTKTVRKIHVTDPPTGLAITRADTKMTATWKIGDKDYGGGQTFKYRINGGKWVNVSIGATTKSKTFLTLNWANYYPNAGKPYLRTVEISIVGCRSPWYKDTTKKGKTTRTVYLTDESKPATFTYTFVAPSAPAITATRSEEYDNMCTFVSSVANPTDAGNKLTRTEWKGFLLQNSNQTSGPAADLERKVESESGTGGAAVTYSKAETYTPSGPTSYTRWFAARAIGPAGASAWSYARCLYAFPYPGVIKSAVANAANFGGYMCTVKWDSPYNNAHPIDLTEVEYAIATPAAGMQCPSGASFTVAAQTKETARVDSVTFPVEAAVDEDECLFARVTNTFADKQMHGAPVLMSGGVGVLKEPTITDVETNQTTHRATITATNTSAVPDSFLAIRYITEDDPNGFVVGIIPHGETSVTVQCPSWQPGEQIVFGIYAVVGTATQTTRADGVSSYTIRESMRSAIARRGGVIPAAPTVSLAATDIVGTIRVTFNWSWSAAGKAEISWADHEDAWESTDEPNTYEISNTHASAWNISGLDTGKKWYVRVRLSAGSEDNKTYGTYSDIAEIDLSSAPSIPVLTLSPAIITEGGSATAAWEYTSTDGTLQSSAEVAEVTEEDGETVYTRIAGATTAQYATIDAAGWESGETHILAVRVTSESGHTSEWSEPVSIAVAEPLDCSMTTSLVSESITTDEVTRVVNALTEMPLTVTVTGAGESGITTVIVERTETYDIARPDESRFIGYKGETVAMWTQTGESQIVFDQDALIGHLDDEAPYRIIATVQDSLGQSAQTSIDFEVHWTHQAIIPEATAEADNDDLIAILTPVAPDGTATGDVCDIYRLSVDKPELIYPNAEFGTEYVDPYPTIGEHGGHRFVLKTANGDYITADNELAWLDLGDADGDEIDSDYNIIDFGTGRFMFKYNIELSNSWVKDFTETKYLGGSIQGDWNPAVSRKSSAGTVSILADDEGAIEAARRLATYAGICHVRSKDGSSYPADVQLTETYSASDGNNLATFSLSITRVDTESYDGMTLAEWRETHPVEEQEEQEE